MAWSRRCLESGLEGVREIEDSPENVQASSCEGNDGLVVAFTLASLALRLSSTRGTPRGLFGRCGSIAFHSRLVSS